MFDISNLLPVSESHEFKLAGVERNKGYDSTLFILLPLHYGVELNALYRDPVLSLHRHTIAVSPTHQFERRWVHEHPTFTGMISCLLTISLPLRLRSFMPTSTIGMPEMKAHMNSLTLAL